jgi:hypothetical protein
MAPASAPAVSSAASSQLAHLDADVERVMKQFDVPGIAVAVVKDGPVLSLSRTPDLTGELEHFQHDTFTVRWKERNFNADAYVTFALNPDGSIERMKMQPISTETDFSYDFQDLSFTPLKK